MNHYCGSWFIGVWGMPPGIKLTCFMVWNNNLDHLKQVAAYSFITALSSVDCSIRVSRSSTTIASWRWRPCKPTTLQARKLPMRLKQYVLLDCAICMTALLEQIDLEPPTVHMFVHEWINESTISFCSHIIFVLQLYFTAPFPTASKVYYF